MRKRLAMCALALTTSFGLISSPVAAQSAGGGDWIQDILNPNCSPESKQALAGSVREKIEQSVGRAIAAIQPPAAVGDLSCLNDLMNAPLDKFSNIGGLLGNLQGGFGNSIGSLTGDLDISRRVCQFAAEKWSKVTGPLDKGLDQLSGAGSDIWKNFDLGKNGKTPSNTGSNSGQWNPDSPNPNLGPDTDVTNPQPAPLPPIVNGCTSIQVAMNICRQPTAAVPVNPGNGAAPGTPGFRGPGSPGSDGRGIWGNITGGDR